VLLTYGATEYARRQRRRRSRLSEYVSPGIRLPYTQVRTVRLDGDSISAYALPRESAWWWSGRITPGYLGRNTTKASARSIAGSLCYLGRFDARLPLLTVRVKIDQPCGPQYRSSFIVGELLNPRVMLAAA